MRKNMDWFQKLLPPKVKIRQSAVRIGGTEMELGKFRPHLFYNKKLGVLQVLLRDCSRSEVYISRPFDILLDNHLKKGKGNFVGFNLWGVRGMLHDQQYKKTSISLEHIIKRFDRHYGLLFGKGVFGKYKEQLLSIAREHQFVWHIPK